MNFMRELNTHERTVKLLFKKSVSTERESANERKKTLFRGRKLCPNE